MRLISFFLVAVLVGLAFETFTVKHATWQTKQELSRLNSGIKETKSAIQFQRAEWSLINRPELLEKRTASLGLTTPPAERIMAMSEVLQGLRAIQATDDAVHSIVAGDGSLAARLEDIEIAQTAE